MGKAGKQEKRREPSRLEKKMSQLKGGTEAVVPEKRSPEGVLSPEKSHFTYERVPFGLENASVRTGKKTRRKKNDWMGKKKGVDNQGRMPASGERKGDVLAAGGNAAGGGGRCPSRETAKTKCIVQTEPGNPLRGGGGDAT